jgi:hypothetical protein
MGFSWDFYFYSRDTSAVDIPWMIEIPRNHPKFYPLVIHKNYGTSTIFIAG